MVGEIFYVKKERLEEVKKFIREQMPSCRFRSNPYSYDGENYEINITYEIEDMNKLSKLQNKYYEEDNPKIIKPSLFKRILNFLF